jgi:hypothetical protein
MKASATKASFGSCIVFGAAAVVAFLFAPPAKSKSTPYAVINAAAASSDVTTNTRRGGVAVLAIGGANTLVNPGHEPIGEPSQTTEFREMLVAIRARVAALKARGMSLEEVRAARPTREFDAKWGTSVVSGDLFTQLVFRGV